MPQCDSGAPSQPDLGLFADLLVVETPQELTQAVVHEHAQALASMCSILLYSNCSAA